MPGHVFHIQSMYRVHSSLKFWLASWDLMQNSNNPLGHPLAFFYFIICSRLLCSFSALDPWIHLDFLWRSVCFGFLLLHCGSHVFGLALKRLVVGEGFNECPTWDGELQKVWRSLWWGEKGDCRTFFHESWGEVEQLIFLGGRKGVTSQTWQIQQEPASWSELEWSARKNQKSHQQKSWWIVGVLQEAEPQTRVRSEFRVVCFPLVTSNPFFRLGFSFKTSWAGYIIAKIYIQTFDDALQNDLEKIALQVLIESVINHDHFDNS